MLRGVDSKSVRVTNLQALERVRRMLSEQGGREASLTQATDWALHRAAAAIDPTYAEARRA